MKTNTGGIMEKHSYTSLNRIASNVSQLGDRLKMTSSSVEFHSMAMELEGYAKIVEAWSIRLSEQGL